MLIEKINEILGCRKTVNIYDGKIIYFFLKSENIEHFFIGEFKSDQYLQNKNDLFRQVVFVLEKLWMSDLNHQMQ